MPNHSGRLGDDLTGRFLDGRYRIEKVLDKGGMATVYLARDEQLSREVAVKVPHVALLKTPGSRERFQDEIRSLTTLSHTNIIGIIDVGEVEGRPYAVLQYVEANSLADHLEKLGRPLTIQELNAWLPQVAGALDFIHEQGLIHRDVKPANILLDKVGNVYLADFGLVKALGEKASELSVTMGRPGSPHFTGPEIATAKVLGPPYDQYALGVTVYEALGGELPWTDQPQAKALALKRKADAPPLAEWVPAEVDRVVRRSLERKPGNRHPSCQAFAEAYAAAVASAPPASSAKAPELPARSRRQGKAAASGTDDTWHGSHGATTQSGAVPMEDTAAVKSDRRPPLLSSETHAYDVKARGRKRTPPALVAAVVVMVILLAAVIIAKTGGEEKKGPVAAVPLKVKLRSPPRAALINDPKVVVTGIVNEAVTSVLVDEIEAEIADDLTFRVELELEEEGEHQIRVVARNTAGQTKESFAQVTLDRTAPVLTIVKPEPGASESTRQPEFEVVGMIDDKLADVFHGKEQMSLDPEGRFNLRKRLKKEGPYSYEFRATDGAGNETTATVSVIYDRTDPKVAILSPRANTTVVTPAGFMVLKGKVDDPTCYVTVNGQPTTVDEKGRFVMRAQVPLKITEGQTFRIDVLARDAAGNDGRASRKFVRGAGLILSEPADGAATPESWIAVRGLVADATVPVTVNERDVQPNADGSFETRVDLGGEGAYDLHVKTVDSRGRETAYDRRVYRDKTLPVLRVTAPKTWLLDGHETFASDGAIIEFWGTVRDASPCVVTVNGVRAKVKKDGRWYLPLRVHYDMQEYVLRVVDAAGNEPPLQRRHLQVSAPDFKGLSAIDRDASGRSRFAPLKDRSVVLLLLPGGAFQMGAIDADEEAREEEWPRHSVSVTRLLISAYEITWAQFMAFVEAAKIAFPRERRPDKEILGQPAVGLSRGEIQAYCAWLGGRLPTEAEWEYAARGGDEGRVYPWGNEWDSRQANIRGHSEALADVGTSGTANGYGLYDVLGNAAELCADWYAKYPAEETPEMAADPTGPATGTAHVVRGGTFLDGPENARLSARRRLRLDDEDGRALVGFRVVFVGD